MMRRYQAGLYVIAGITIVLLLLWGVDLSRSVASDESAGPFRTEVSVWTAEADAPPFLDMLQKDLAANERNANDCILVFRGEHGMLIWKHGAHPGGKNSDPIHLSGLESETSVGRVILITFRSSDGRVEGRGSRVVVIHETVAGGESSPEQSLPTQINLPIVYPFGG